MRWGAIFVLDRLFSWAWRPERASANLDRLTQRLDGCQTQLRAIREAHVNALVDLPDGARDDVDR